MTTSADDLRLACALALRTFKQDINDDFGPMLEWWGEDERKVLVIENTELLPAVIGMMRERYGVPTRVILLSDARMKYFKGPDLPDIQRGDIHRMAEEGDMTVVECLTTCWVEPEGAYFCHDPYVLDDHGQVVFEKDKPSFEQLGNDSIDGGFIPTALMKAFEP